MSVPTPPSAPQPPSPAPPSDRHDALGAFRHPEFRAFQGSRLLAMTSVMMQVTAVSFQVYKLTGSKTALGLVGLAAFLPKVALALFTGHAADRHDRRRIVQVCQALHMAGAAALLALTLSPAPPLWGFLAAVTFIGAAHAFYSPASQALMPSLVPAAVLPNAVAWNAVVWQGAAIGGPALAGLLLAWKGPAFVYAADIVAMALGMALIGFVKPRPVAPTGKAADWDTLLAGLRYIRERPIILGAISMDLFAVLLGGATALIPVFAIDILKVGESGYGALRAAPAVGAAVTSLVVTMLPPFRRAGLALFVSVAVFGAGTIGFGLSTSFPLSLACLFVLGAADMVSVVIRQVMVQLMTPPEMRGRVSAVNLIFIGASNELGEFESGVAAAWLGTVPAVVLGGVGTLGVVAVWAAVFPALRKFGRLDQHPV